MGQQVIIITGASRGLGAATAKITAQLGAYVVINARSEEALTTVADEIHSTGGTALPVSGDVSHVEDCWRLVNRTLREFGGVDAIINNAGVIEPVAFISDADPRSWRENIEINLLGPVYLTQAALPHLRKQKGKVVTVSSGAAVRVIEGWSAYCTAKAAINHFNRILASEEKDITSLTFRPGAVNTEMQAIIRDEGEEGMPPETHERYTRMHREGQLLPPEVPGRALAVVCLHAPWEWSGDFISWDEEKVQSLVEQYYPKISDEGF